MIAHSETTGREYPSWESLVEAEANGYVVIGVSTRPGTAPVAVGPFPTKGDANRARVRLRRAWVREEQGFQVTTSVRVLWEDPQTLKEATGR